MTAVSRRNGLGDMANAKALGSSVLADVTSVMDFGIIVGALFQPIAGYVFLLDGVLIGAGDGRRHAGNRAARDPARGTYPADLMR